jgi:nucleotidyltransferase/DNA polymerase involved in DNA repair
MKDSRQLTDLVGVGSATLKDFKVLKIKTVAELKRKNPQKLYEELCDRTGQTHDICALDVFSATVAQAKNPGLPKEKCNWWYWSKIRKKAKKK